MQVLRHCLRLALITLFAFAPGSLIAQDLEKSVSKKITLQYISPSDLTDANIVKEERIATNTDDVTIKINSSTNEILLMGSESAIQSASSMIEFLDVPPKQIVVEVKIIEVNSQKLQNIGIDWQKILANTSVPFQYSYSRWHNNSSSDGTSSGSTQRTEETSYGVSNSMKIGDFLNVLVSSDAAKVLNIPKIVTVNNKKGTIHDGSRILYVDKYASYSNLFQTQELKTGLYLSVTPSLGASGYIKMNVEAKLTDLNNASNDLRPIEVGQTVENIVVVKEGQSIMLGGLKKTSTEKIDNSLPILGSILPFLFSSQKNIEITNDVLLILTPTTIDITKVQAPDTLNEKSEK